MNAQNSRRAVPSAPDVVLCECWTDPNMQRIEARWQTIERTIEGEVIRNAMATVDHHRP